MILYEYKILCLLLQVDKYATVKTLVECTLCLGLTTEDIRHLYILLSTGSGSASGQFHTKNTANVVIKFANLLKILIFFCLNFISNLFYFVFLIQCSMYFFQH